MNTYLFSSNVVCACLDLSEGTFTDIFTDHVVTDAPVFTSWLLSLIRLIVQARLAWACPFSCRSLRVTSCIAIFLCSRFLIVLSSLGCASLSRRGNSELSKRLVVHVVIIRVILIVGVFDASKFTHFLGKYVSIYNIGAVFVCRSSSKARLSKLNSISFKRIIILNRSIVPSE